jgi:hypothetical protein
MKSPFDVRAVKMAWPSFFSSRTTVSSSALAGQPRCMSTWRFSRA